MLHGNKRVIDTGTIDSACQCAREQNKPDRTNNNNNLPK